MTTQILYCIIRGKWKSPNHSSDRSKDDTHKIKEEILKEIGKIIYEKSVGKNPDLDIDPKTKKIILKGRGDFYTKIFESGINADSYFVEYLITQNKRYPYYLHKNSKDSKPYIYYIIPPDIDMLSLLLDHIFKQENNFVIKIAI